jgi:hypothetical protein
MLLLKPVAKQLWVHFKRLILMLIHPQPSVKAWERLWILWLTRACHLI